MKKNYVEFCIYEDLEKVNSNSLLIDSDTEVAGIKIGDFYFSLMCYGEVRVNYKGDTYFRASDYPKEIVDYLMGNENAINETEDDFWVGDNNWFQLDVLRKNDEGMYELVFDTYDTFDIEGYLESDDQYKTKSMLLYEEMAKSIIEMKNQYDELIDLDISNL